MRSSTSAESWFSYSVLSDRERSRWGVVVDLQAEPDDAELRAVARLGQLFGGLGDGLGVLLDLLDEILVAGVGDVFECGGLVLDDVGHQRQERPGIGRSFVGPGQLADLLAELHDAADAVLLLLEGGDVVGEDDGVDRDDDGD